MNIIRKLGFALALAGAPAALDSALAEDGTISIGVVSIFEGPFTVQGQDTLRGVEVAVKEFGGTVAGKKIKLVVGSSDSTPDSAVRATRKLVEQDGVEFVIGPLSGDEGIAVKNYAATKPNVTFLNGTSGAQETTMRDPAPNFFRFGTDGAQWMAGLGRYAYDNKGYRKVAVVAEDYSFPYTQVFGFMSEFCAAGGKVPEKFWVPIGTKDYSSVIAAMPDDIDAVFVDLGGADSVNFLTQYLQSGGSAPLVGGTVTVDQTVLTAKGRIRDVLIGTPSAGPLADSLDTPAWNAFVTAYKAQPDAFPTPSLFAHGYYLNAKALLLALDMIGGEPGDGGAKLRSELARTTFDGPTGRVSLDENRNAIADIFLTEVAENQDGTLYNKLVKVVPQVNQKLGFTPEAFAAFGAVSRENPSCQ
ncbi:ABC transporter substrate-binding protein [Mesorhizobium australicum]|uniref:ABC transporter substrate-binding protein n=1 Tax=Mesorhizobium australicum TaxID=536018 RepID=UPI00333959F4